MPDKRYPCDIIREEFVPAHSFLENVKKKTKPREVDLYDIFCAINYIDKTGSQWKNLPKDYPKHSTVYYYFSQWSKEYKNTGLTILEQLQEILIKNVRKKLGREENTTFLILDSQSVKNTDTAKEKGYDGGKKISGIKRNMGVDIEGFPHVIHITKANISDIEGAKTMFSNRINVDEKFFEKVENISVDGTYRGPKFATAIKELIGATVEVVKKIEKNKFKPLRNRWIVERTFAWAEKYRRLWKNCEGTFTSSKAMFQLPFIVLLLKRLNTS